MSRSHATLRKTTASGARPWPSSVWSLWCVMLAVGMLATIGLRLSHMLFVQHVVCEHGQLVDANASEAHAAVHALAQAPRADLEQGSPADCAHDHCDALAIHHRVGVELPGPVLGPAPSFIEIAFAAPSEPAFGPSPLDYAPKNSPPRSAVAL